MSKGTSYSSGGLELGSLQPGVAPAFWDPAPPSAHHPQDAHINTGQTKTHRPVDINTHKLELKVAADSVHQSVARLSKCFSMLFTEAHGVQFL